MAFADPQTVTYSGGSNSLPRVASGQNQGRFWASIGANTGLGLEISHQYGARTRRLVRVSLDEVVSSPFNSTISNPQSTYCYLVLNTPAQNGVVVPETAVKAVKSVADWLTASSYANALAFCQGQN